MAFGPCNIGTVTAAQCTQKLWSHRTVLPCARRMAFTVGQTHGAQDWPVEGVEWPAVRIPRYLGQANGCRLVVGAGQRAWQFGDPRRRSCRIGAGALQENRRLRRNLCWWVVVIGLGSLLFDTTAIELTKWADIVPIAYRGDARRRPDRGRKIRRATQFGRKRQVEAFQSQTKATFLSAFCSKTSTPSAMSRPPAPS